MSEPTLDERVRALEQWRGRLVKVALCALGAAITPLVAWLLSKL